MAILYIYCGIPGSGKSYYASKHKLHNTEYLSRDEIRFSMVREDEEYFSRENEVYELFVKGIANALKFNKEVYADATHLNERSRARLLRALGKNLKDVEVNIIYVRVPVEVALM